MSRLLLIFTFGLVVAAPSALGAKAKKSAKRMAKPKAQAERLQTDVRFDDSVLHGQYQIPDEALAKVENEKVLSDLLGVRKHFKDRLAEASEQE